MVIKLNDEAVAQLNAIMAMTGRTNYKHTVQTLLSQVLNNLRRAEYRNKATTNI